MVSVEWGLGRPHMWLWSTHPTLPWICGSGRGPRLKNKRPGSGNEAGVLAVVARMVSTLVASQCGWFLSPVAAAGEDYRSGPAGALLGHVFTLSWRGHAP